jgi:hypothetical protein
MRRVSSSEPVPNLKLITIPVLAIRNQKELLVLKWVIFGLNVVSIILILDPH